MRLKETWIWWSGSLCVLFDRTFPSPQASSRHHSTGIITAGVGVVSWWMEYNRSSLLRNHGRQEYNCRLDENSYKYVTLQTSSIVKWGAICFKLKMPLMLFTVTLLNVFSLCCAVTWLLQSFCWGRGSGRKTVLTTVVGAWTLPERVELQSKNRKGRGSRLAYLELRITYQKLQTPSFFLLQNKKDAHWCAVCKVYNLSTSPGLFNVLNNIYEKLTYFIVKFFFNSSNLLFSYIYSFINYNW